MTNCNTMTRGRFLLSNAFWLLIATYWFRRLFFIPLSGRTEAASVKILWGMVVLAVIGGILLTLGKRRNYLSVAVNVLFPYPIYILISYWKDCSFWTKVLFFATFLGFIRLFWLLAFRGMQPEEKNGAVLRKRVRHGLLGVRTLFVVFFFVASIPLGVYTYFGNELHQPQEAAPAPTEEWSMDEGAEDLVKLMPEAWAKLDMRERLNVLDVLKNQELQHLGIYRDILLDANDLEGETWGRYSHKDGKIVIDVSHLQNSPVEKVVHTVLHECHHAYTHQQVELYQRLPEEYKGMLMFQSVQIIEKEYANYVNGNENYEKYAEQLCETSADRYADKTMESYYNAILKYMNKQKKN